ncbi:hypothetical protein T492DRAFT_913718 [Pavlovales sp. CCMP2436]|nr:hypothetical protein T492DRAFT_913718 [Pavlovales sp. CCMP2436]
MTTDPWPVGDGQAAVAARVGRANNGAQRRVCPRTRAAPAGNSGTKARAGRRRGRTCVAPPRRALGARSRRGKSQARATGEPGAGGHRGHRVPHVAQQRRAHPCPRALAAHADCARGRCHNADLGARLGRGGRGGRGGQGTRT